MTQYKFDIRTGHYYAILNEGEATPDVDSQAQAQGSAETSVPTPSLKNLETEEIMKMKKDMNTKLDNIQKEIDTKQDVIMQIKDKIAKLLSSDQVTQAGLNELQKQLLLAKLDLENKKFDKAKMENDETKKILAAQEALVESMIVKRKLPEKYKYLTESNILNAKIHVDKLIKDDVQLRITGMVDFKKAFVNSELLYGKDKDGFYAVCIDQQDFNKLTNTLEEVGYLRDEILSCCLPQIFDRSDMVK